VPSGSIAILEVIVAIAWLFAFAVNRAMIRRGKATPWCTSTTNTESKHSP
jgi:hypothetical protein